MCGIYNKTQIHTHIHTMHFIVCTNIFYLWNIWIWSPAFIFLFSHCLLHSVFCTQILYHCCAMNWNSPFPIVQISFCVIIMNNGHREKEKLLPSDRCVGKYSMVFVQWNAIQTTTIMICWLSITASCWCMYTDIYVIFPGVSIKASYWIYFALSLCSYSVCMCSTSSMYCMYRTCTVC